MAAELVVRCTTDLAEIDPAEWDGVVAAAGAPVFYSHAYISAYHRWPLAPVDGHAYFVVRRRHDDAAVAVLPAYLQHRPDPIGCLTTAYPRLDGPALLSHVWHCYDTRLPGTVPPAELVPLLVPELRAAARRLGAPWCGLVCLERGGAAHTALHDAGFPLRHLVDRFAMDLRGITDFTGYLDRLGHDHRHNLRRHLRRAAEAGVSTEVLPVAKANLAEIAELCGRTAARFGNTTFYRPETFGAFVTELGEHAHAIEVRQRGRLVSTVVCLVDQRRFHAWTGGVDYEVDGRFSAYRVMHAAFIRLAIELGRPVLEGGRSNGAFKTQHGMSPRPLDAMLIPA